MMVIMIRKGSRSKGGNQQGATVNSVPLLVQVACRIIRRFFFYNSLFFFSPSSFFFRTYRRGHRLVAAACRLMTIRPDNQGKRRSLSIYDRFPPFSELQPKVPFWVLAVSKARRASSPLRGRYKHS